MFSVLRTSPSLSGKKRRSFDTEEENTKCDAETGLHSRFAVRPIYPPYGLENQPDGHDTVLTSNHSIWLPQPKKHREAGMILSHKTQRNFPQLSNIKESMF